MLESLRSSDAYAGVVGEIDGYGTFGPCRDDGWVGGEVRSLFVDPPAWGSGAANAVMDAGLSWLAGRGFDRVCVWSFVDNARARRFYARWGFEPDGVRDALEPFANLVGERLVRALDTSASAGSASP